MMFVAFSLFTNSAQMSALSMNLSQGGLLVLSAFVLTLLAHVLSRWINSKLPTIPAIVLGIGFVVVFLWLLRWDYRAYYQVAEPVFNHLLGYVTVMLAIPLASLNFSGLPLRKLARIVMLATLIGALLPMLLAVGFQLSYQTVLAFATRSVTAPIGLNIATLINAPLVMANLIIMISGIAGGSLAQFLFKNIHDDRAKGLALGLVAHAFGTVEAWQISPTAGRYASFGLAVNGMITAIWLPIVVGFWQSIF